MIHPRLRTLALLAVFWAACLAGPGPARAADAIEVRSASLTRSPAGDGWLLSADFTVPLQAQQGDAINRGVTLYFTVDFELVRPRWYWLDEKVAEATRTYRVNYHALTRQYRVTHDGLLPRSFDTLDEALDAMSRLRGWKVLGPDEVRPGGQYEAALRMRLDTSLLPVPLQAGTIANRDWTLRAEWKRFRFEP